MNKVTALHIPAQRTAPIDHPKWCEHGACENNLDAATVDHKQRVARWEAMGHDALVEVDLVAEDEFHPQTGRWTRHPAEARLFLNWNTVVAKVPCTIDHEVPVKAEVYLRAAEARRLAADLLEAADRIDVAGATR